MDVPTHNVLKCDSRYQCQNCPAGHLGDDAHAKALAHVKEHQHSVKLIVSFTTEISP